MESQGWASSHSLSLSHFLHPEKNKKKKKKTHDKSPANMTRSRVFKQKLARNRISGRPGHLPSLITIKVVPSKPFYSDIRNIRVCVRSHDLRHPVSAAPQLPMAPQPPLSPSCFLPPFNISFPMTRQPSFTNLKGKLNAGLTKLS